MGAKRDEADPFAWMRRVATKRARAHYVRENARCEAALAPIMPLADEIFAEILARMPPTEDTVPYRYGDYEYRFSHGPGTRYPVFQRRPASGDQAFEPLLDYASLAEGDAHLDVQVAVDRASSRLAFAVDRSGAGVYRIGFKDIATGALAPTVLDGASGNMAFSRDGRFLLYVELDADTLRWRRVKRHHLGDDPAAARTVLDDPDEAFSCYVRPARSDACLFLHRTSGVADEVFVIDPRDPTAPPRSLQPLREGLEYEPRFDGDGLVVRTNLEAPDFTLMRAPFDAASAGEWRPFWRPEPGVFLEAFDVARGHVVVKERIDGAVRLRVLDAAGQTERVIEPADPAIGLDLGANEELDATTIRFTRSSYVGPTETREYDVVSGARRLVKRETWAPGFSPDGYACERLSAPRPDGARVPVTLLRRVDAGEAPRPTLLHAYGAYGFGIDPHSWLPRYGLMDRGFHFAIAHVRGGGEMGRLWRDAGRGAGKAESVADLVACAELLLASGRASSIHLLGESAGGFLVAAALNARAELFASAAAIAPFVDVLNTLSDPSLPLSVADAAEWGDPNKPEERALIRAVSPYENVAAAAYPPILALTRMNDSQVPVWEAAKWLARVARASTRPAPYLLRVEFDAGHMGRSGRDEQFRDTALVQAFAIGVERGLVAGSKAQPMPKRSRRPKSIGPSRSGGT